MVNSFTMEGKANFCHVISHLNVVKINLKESWLFCVFQNLKMNIPFMNSAAVPTTRETWMLGAEIELKKLWQ